MTMAESIETNRKILLGQQTRLRELLERPDPPEMAMDLFFQQHAQLHRSKVTHSGFWSFADAVLNGLTVEQIRRIPGSSNHSIAWCLWHIARIEDATMNLLVDGSNQVFNQGDWRSRLEVDICNTGNGMSDQEVAKLSAAINPMELFAYRDAVGLQTRKIVSRLIPEQIHEKVHRQRIERLLDEGVLLDEGRGLADYWGNRTIAGLLLMPATRHNLSHLNECLKLRKAKG